MILIPPQMSTVNHEKARRLLENTWEQITNDDENEHVEEYIIRKKINQIIDSPDWGHRTFKYIFLTNCLAKAVNPDIHMLAVKQKADLDGGFSSGNLAYEVVTEWDKDHGKRLGGSDEPRTNNAYDQDGGILKEDFDATKQDSYDRLYNTCSRIESEVNKGELDPEDVLKQVLYEISKIDSRVPDYTNPPELQFNKLQEGIISYLETSAIGERLEAVVAAAFDSQYYHFSDDQPHIEVYHVNTPDDNSKIAGDIEIYEPSKEENLLNAIEVKDKKVTAEVVKSCIDTAKQFELNEYHIIAGKGVVENDDSENSIQDIVDEADIEILLINKDELIGTLKFVGRDGRKRFSTAVLKYLNEMKSQAESYDAWKSFIQSEIDID